MKSFMAKNLEAYLDTSALISFADKSDSHHLLFRGLFSDPPRLVTTPLVAAEGHAWFLRRYDPTKALRFLAMLETLRPLLIISVDSDVQAAATEILRRLSDQRLTMADAVGLHVMSERRIGICWSTDFHLGLTGVPLVIHR